MCVIIQCLDGANYMGIELHPLIFNPFSLTGFDQIWGDRSDYVEEDCLYTLQHPDDDNNKKYFIVDARQYPIGLTGYYVIDGRVILAWHGIIPQYRSNGASTIALQLLAAKIRSSYPNATELIELVPEDREDEVGPYFMKLGFVPTGIIFDHPDFVDTVVWKEYHINLDKLINHEYLEYID